MIYLAGFLPFLAIKVWIRFHLFSKFPIQAIARPHLDSTPGTPPGQMLLSAVFEAMSRKLMRKMSHTKAIIIEFETISWSSRRRPALSSLGPHRSPQRVDHRASPRTSPQLQRSGPLVLVSDDFHIHHCMESSLGSTHDGKVRLGRYQHIVSVGIEVPMAT